MAGAAVDIDLSGADVANVHHDRLAVGDVVRDAFVVVADVDTPVASS